MADGSPFVSIDGTVLTVQTYLFSAVGAAGASSVPVAPGGGLASPDPALAEAATICDAVVPSAVAANVKGFGGARLTAVTVKGLGDHPVLATCTVP